MNRNNQVIRRNNVDPVKKSTNTVVYVLVFLFILAACSFLVTLAFVFFEGNLWNGFVNWGTGMLEGILGLMEVFVGENIVLGCSDSK